MKIFAKRKKEKKWSLIKFQIFPNRHIKIRFCNIYINNKSLFASIKISWISYFFRFSFFFYINDITYGITWYISWRQGVQKLVCTLSTVRSLSSVSAERKKAADVEKFMVRSLRIVPVAIVQSRPWRRWRLYIRIPDSRKNTVFCFYRARSSPSIPRYLTVSINARYRTRLQRPATDKENESSFFIADNSSPLLLFSRIYCHVSLNNTASATISFVTRNYTTKYIYIYI